jgi:hypothetical protein
MRDERSMIENESRDEKRGINKRNDFRNTHKLFEELIYTKRRSIISKTQQRVLVEPSLN